MHRFMKLSLITALVLSIAAFFSDWFVDKTAVEQEFVPEVYLGESNAEDRWADSVMATLSLEKKIAQLIMMEAYSDKDAAYRDQVSEWVTKYGIGGLMFKKGGPVRQVHLANHWQSLSKVPLLMSIDGEWGVAMRLDSVPAFPWNMTLGAIQNDSLLVEFGALMAEQCRMTGVQMNFAPVVDVNNNPANPVINARSFGEQANVVADKGLAVMRGLQNNGVLASAKHFPGHGDTDKDSHKTLPTVQYNRAHLDSVELVPFRRLIANGLASVMVAHLNIPIFNDGKVLASSLNPKVVTGLLKDEMGFEGLVITDGLNMKGVSDYYTSGALEVQALKAGNDILLLPASVTKTISAVVEAINNGELSVQRIEESCRKVLKAKYRTGLNKKNKLETAGLYDKLNRPEVHLMNYRLFEGANTVLRNQDDIIPFKNLEATRMVYIAFEDDKHTAFRETLRKYKEMPYYHIDTLLSKYSLEQLETWIKQYDVVIAGVHKNSASPWKDYKIGERTKRSISAMRKQVKVVAVVFDNPYGLINWQEAGELDGLVMAYQNHPIAQEVAAQLLFGGRGASGKLPVSCGSAFPAGKGLTVKGGTRMGYGLPEEVGFDSKALLKMENYIREGIAEGAYPGCQLFIAKKGIVIWDKAYGHQTYSKTRAVSTEDIYDLASITKIAASTALLMRMYDDGMLHLDLGVGYHMGMALGSNKANLSIRDILAHQAGLKPWIPFYKATIDNKGQPKTGWYSTQKSDAYPWEVASDFFITQYAKDSIMKVLLGSDLIPGNKYLYSDLGYYLMQEMIQGAYGNRIDSVADEWLYSGLGADRLTYNPLRKFPANEICPTEMDNYYRHQELRGHVHDMGAAMLDGVAGHAGLFSNANDLGKLMHMYLFKGQYGERQFVSKEAIEEFTRCQFCDVNNRRGIGFDKPTIDGSGGPTCNCVSLLSFGHSGFTGTLAWVDPQEEIVYIFLSNRTYPTAENRKLITMGTRTKVMQVIYDNLNTYQPTKKKL